MRVISGSKDQEVNVMTTHLNSNFYTMHNQSIIVHKSLVSGTSSSITKKKRNLELSPLSKRRCVRRIT